MASSHPVRRKVCLGINPHKSSLRWYFLREKLVVCCPISTVYLVLKGDLLFCVFLFLQILFNDDILLNLNCKIKPKNLLLYLTKAYTVSCVLGQLEASSSLRMGLGAGNHSFPFTGEQAGSPSEVTCPRPHGLFSGGAGIRTRAEGSRNCMFLTTMHHMLY